MDVCVCVFLYTYLKTNTYKVMWCVLIIKSSKRSPLAMMLEQTQIHTLSLIKISIFFCWAQKLEEKNENIDNAQYHIIILLYSLLFIQESNKKRLRSWFFALTKIKISLLNLSSLVHSFICPSIYRSIHQSGRSF